MLAQLAFNLRLKSGGEETSRYAVKPKGGVSAAATEAEGNNLCVAISSAEHRKQVALLNAGGPAACSHATLIHAHWAGSYEDLEPARKGA